MSLSAVEALCHNRPAAPAPEPANDISTSTIQPSHSVQQPQASLDASQHQAAKADNALRVYVSEDRMWFAICGHSKDFTKVFEMQFVLLSIIAAHREGGILQGELIRESGQDKRSVPKRTDSLRDKGYIEKRAVHIRGLKTSRLVLRKFASPVANDVVMPMPVSVGPQGSVQAESIDFNILIKNIFTILKDMQIVTRDDLKEKLDMKTQWRARVLAKVIRKFEAIGCLRRVKAATEASKKVRYYFDCVKLIHEPSEQDMKAFHSISTNVKNDHTVEEPDIDDDEDAHEIRYKQVAGTDATRLEEVGREVPQWNPDRSLANTLLDVIQDAGIKGLTNRVGNP
jgi:B-block binding subunit of TFIIIC